MNERIKELEDQCWVQVPCDFDMKAGGASTIWTVFDRKKFAELIVQECLNLIGNPICPNHHYTVIQNHFGVDHENL